MKTAELIKLLNTANPDSEVKIQSTPDEYDPSEITEVLINNEVNKVTIKGED